MMMIIIFAADQARYCNLKRVLKLQKIFEKLHFLPGDYS
jgi:hypothetical protein